ncbi:MAG: hypothetical protein K6A66_06850 [Streptococcus sp.]|uniref:hypothetical protein n=1 Tax=Streptococcus TaxID=1301 RepID=UPI00057D66CD|nr:MULTISPECIES: hypothetical protein [Streptococcus]MCQ9216433.1 hypothetical protein [Streptococcus gallolyticus]MCR5052394.1 hypothetical protein [Streptococcus sp.]
MKTLTIKEKMQIILVTILSAVLYFILVIDLMQGSGKNYFVWEILLILLLSSVDFSRTRFSSLYDVVYNSGLGLIGVAFLLDSTDLIYKVAAFCFILLALVGFVRIFYIKRLDKEENDD